jgi:hypothetical protein
VCIAAIIWLYHLIVSKLPENQRFFIEYAATKAVHAVEQAMNGASSSMKKQDAVRRMQDYLHHFGIQVPDSLIDTAIESAVKLMNQYQAKPDTYLFDSGDSLHPIAPIAQDQPVQAQPAPVAQPPAPAQ